MDTRDTVTVEAAEEEVMEGTKAMEGMEEEAMVMENKLINFLAYCIYLLTHSTCSLIIIPFRLTH